MKTICVSLLFTGLVAAHSAVWSITFDGTLYPARDGRIDDLVNAKRVEWYRDETQPGNPWASVNDVESNAIACGLNARVGKLNAVARAGSNVTVTWSGMIKMHHGPVSSYLGAFPNRDMKPADIKFFKISGAGYDKARKLWANEELLLEHNRADTFQLPSDIKPGTYVLRTKLLALHGNTVQGAANPTNGRGPQFYTHCFTVNITGSGTAEPQGVQFPGAYKRNDPGVKFVLFADKESWKGYVTPGPPKYAGKYDAPTGPVPVVSDAGRGILSPPEFQAAYKALKVKWDQHAEDSANIQNKLNPGGYNYKGKGAGYEIEAAGGPKGYANFWTAHAKEASELKAELKVLINKGVELGVVPKPAA